MAEKKTLNRLSTGCTGDGYVSDCVSDNAYSTPMCKDGTCVNCETYYADGSESDKLKVLFDPDTHGCVATCPTAKPVYDANKICAADCKTGEFKDGSECVATCPPEKPVHEDDNVCSTKCKDEKQFWTGKACETKCPKEIPVYDTNKICSAKCADEN